MSKKRSPITTRLWNEGKTIAQWAEENGFKLRNVQAVIYGHNRACAVNPCGFPKLLV